MKLILSILQCLLGFLLGLTALAAGIVFVGTCVPHGNPGTWGCFALAGVYMSLYLGLMASALCTGFGVLFVILSFILKSWLRAAISAGMTVGGAALWLYLLNCSL